MSWGYFEDASGAKGFAERICVPKDETELLAELREAQRQQAPVTIAGGGSGLTGGRVPNGGWLISMEKFRRLDVGPGKATVGAGITLHELHAAAKVSGQFYPPIPPKRWHFWAGLSPVIQADRAASCTELRDAGSSASELCSPAVRF